MSELVIRLFDVYRKSLDDNVDVTVTDHKTGRPVWNVNDAKGTKMVKVSNLTPSDVYVIWVRPSRHRHVGQFVRVGAGPRTEIEIVCPVDPSRVLSVSAPAFANLPQKAQQILGASNLEHPPRNTSGEALYNSPELSFVQKAGLLIITCSPRWAVHPCRMEARFSITWIPFTGCVETACLPRSQWRCGTS